MTMEEMCLPRADFIIDQEGKYTREFDAENTAEGATVERVGPRPMNLNAHAERFAKRLRHELRDHYAVFGEKHLRHPLTECLTHYNSVRPHQGIGNTLRSPRNRRRSSRFCSVRCGAGSGSAGCSDTTPGCSLISVNSGWGLLDRPRAGRVEGPLASTIDPVFVNARALDLADIGDAISFDSAHGG
ncbi:Integrase, catalytic region [Limnoglobus roseus]|uniref:Integrase, catalytic region n=1 Tax=Limnoglobus roseus TaxID=2598579 RepID=A0A5C1AQ55_9BACT|nr:Integrase, catalytic region [Limnoglobus roseus]